MFTLQELATLTDGSVVGDPLIEISGVSEIQRSKPGTITFLGNLQYKKYVTDTQAAAILVTGKNHLKGKSGIVVKNPQLAIAKILTRFSPRVDRSQGTHPGAVIHETASLGKDVSIGAFAVIEAGVEIGSGSRIGPHVVIGQDTIIGEHVQLYPNVTIYHHCTVGDRTVIHSGTVIGSDGFGFVTEDDTNYKIPQNGRIFIGAEIEIGSNCAIDRGTIGETVINDGTKIDNLVHIAHNVRIGKGCLVAGCVGIAGSAEIGDFCILAGQVGVAAHVKIGDRTIIAAKTGVTKSLSGGKVYAGMPAREIREQNRRDAVFAEVTQIKKRLTRLEQQKSS